MSLHVIFVPWCHEIRIQNSGVKLTLSQRPTLALGKERSKSADRFLSTFFERSFPARTFFQMQSVLGSTHEISVNSSAGWQSLQVSVGVSVSPSVQVSAPCGYPYGYP